MDELTEQIVDLTSRLIERRSVSPDDAGCQEILARLLADQGFSVEPLPFGDVSNFWATRGTGAPIVVLAGHTDVVPSGPEEAWNSAPFEAVLADGVLTGRGSADMKGSLAAMILATRNFIATHPDHPGTIAYLITSDEEADAVDGTVRVVEWLQQQNISPDYCIVGEPSSSRSLGDVIRVGRRGSLNGRLIIHGVQGHVAYPDQASNPIHKAVDAIKALTAEVWDQGNDAFPPTSLQFSNIAAGTGANNVIPGQLTADFNLRFSTEQTAAGIEARTRRLLDDTGVDYDLRFTLSGDPFMTATEAFAATVSDAVFEEMGHRPELSTGGGTSDGRFIAKLGTQIVELGPVNATIHSANEQVSVSDLASLSRIYQRILERLLFPDSSESTGA